MSFLDEITGKEINKLELGSEEPVYVPGDFNNAWVVPVDVTDLNRQLYDLQIERIRYTIDALSDDGKVYVCDNWMIPKMGYINYQLAQQISKHSTGYNEIFIMFNFTKEMTYKKWLKLIFWSMAQLSTICCDVDAATPLLITTNSNGKLQRKATLVYNPHISDAASLVNNRYYATTQYIREALIECTKEICSVEQIKKFVNKLSKRWLYTKNATCVSATETLKNNNYLVDNSSNKK